MPNTTTTASMGLIVPTVGSETGPTYATDLNTDLSTIDVHDHSSGKGVAITPSGLNISSDLTFLGNNALAIKSVRFNAQGAALSGPSDLGCCYVTGVDLYYNDENGNQIQITKNGGLNGTPGSISGLSAPASASYVSATPAFVFQSNTNTSANIDGGSLVIRQNIANAKGITLSSPSSLAANYTVTLPTGVPTSEAAVTLDNSGTMTTRVGAWVPTGVMLPYGGGAAPTGWLLCDGSAVSRTTYSVLFGIIGTAYGAGDGSTTFNLPNTQGVFLRGAGTQTVGGISYTATRGTTTGDTMQGHKHTDSGHTHLLVANAAINTQPVSSTTSISVNQPGLTAGQIGGCNTVPGLALSASSAAVLGDPVANSNGTPRLGNETAPVNLGVNYIIKT